MYSVKVPKEFSKLAKELVISIRVCISTSSSVKNGGPAIVIKDKIAKGQMKNDFKQTAIVNSLQEVYEDIQNYSPGKLLSKPPRGLYIYGTVGAGKTMLMDIFYQSVKIKAKRRSHFNNFMADVHSRIHQLKSKTKKKNVWPEKSQPTDPITPVARDLVKEAWLLCFDEFQVTDIADAMILKRLFTEMFDSGMVMIATSNRAPDDLYKNGLQRTNFLPFIPVLKKHCRVVSISGKDYRASISDGIESHYLILGEPGTRVRMEDAFNKLCTIEKEARGPKTLKVLGHKIVFKNTCGSVLYVPFHELCEEPLSASDYIQIAKHFDTILIKDVPKMNLDTRNQARRFILLIDILYDYKVRVMMSAAAPPRHLFTGLSGRDVNDDERVLMDDLRIDKESDPKKFSLLKGQSLGSPKCVQTPIGTDIRNRAKQFFNYSYFNLIKRIYDSLFLLEMEKCAKL